MPRVFHGGRFSVSGTPPALPKLLNLSYKPLDFCFMGYRISEKGLEKALK
jgi:hypothetical protein